MKVFRQYTLGDLQDLARIKPNSVFGIDADFDSYRGYYEHVSFSLGSSTGQEIAAEISSRLGGTMEGYKGGTYAIKRECLVFIADYGNTGPQLVGFEDDGTPIGCDEVWA